MKNVIPILILTLSVACSNNTSDILPQQKMKEIMFDLLAVDEFINTSNIRDTNFIKSRKNLELYHQVFQLHRTTKDQFYKSYLYYQQHPLMYKSILDSLEVYGNVKRSQRK